MSDIVSAVAATHRKFLKKQSNELILHVAPEHKQRNAALGVLSEADAEFIRSSIAAVISSYERAKSELDAVVASDARTPEKLLTIRSIRVSAG